MSERNPAEPALSEGFRVFTVGGGCLVGGVFLILGVIAFGALPNFLHMGWRAKRSELSSNVAAIATAELAYAASEDHYVAADRAPRALPDKQLADWVSNPGFTTLGWKPDGMVRGVYWVELSPDGAHFTVHGLADMDGDGQMAEYTVTDTERRPVLRTDADEY